MRFAITDLNDPKHLAWLYAKMWFRSADINSYVMCTHFSRCHAVSEAMAVATYRNLPNAHPIFRLLQPHVQGIIPVNVTARAVVVNPSKNPFCLFLSAGDSTTSVFSNFFKTFSYDDLIIPQYFEKRGVQDIPEYFFRDDILSHWEILQQYVREMVDLTYAISLMMMSRRTRNFRASSKTWLRTVFVGLKKEQVSHGWWPRKKSWWST